VGKFLLSGREVDTARLSVRRRRDQYRHIVRREKGIATKNSQQKEDRGSFFNSKEEFFSRISTENSMRLQRARSGGRPSSS